MKLAIAVLLLACVATRPAPLSNRAPVAQAIRVEVSRRVHGEFACSSFHVWTPAGLASLGGCWWVR